MIIEKRLFIVKWDSKEELEYWSIGVMVRNKKKTPSTPLLPVLQHSNSLSLHYSSPNKKNPGLEAPGSRR